MIKAPRTITSSNLENLLAIWRSTIGLVDAEIDLDCSALEWVDPAGLCLFRHWIGNLGRRQVQLTLGGLPHNIEAFMRRMNVLDGAPNLLFNDRTSSNRRNMLEDRLVEVIDISSEADVDPAAAKIAKTIVAQMGLSTAPDPEGMRPSAAEMAENTVAYVFMEILGNALSHGRKRGEIYAHAKVAALFVQGRKRLSIAIFDDGCGLLGTLRGHPSLSGHDDDLHAIKAALLPRVSCNRDLDAGLDTKNQGVGLTISTRLALESGGQISIYSGNAYYNERAGGHRQTRTTSGWGGTGVCLEFCADRLASVEVAAILKTLPGAREDSRIKFE